MHINRKKIINCINHKLRYALFFVIYHIPKCKSLNINKNLNNHNCNGGNDYLKKKKIV